MHNDQQLKGHLIKELKVMAKISKEEKEANFKKYNQIILDIFFESGWHCVTYDNIAKVAGVRKSTLQGYYESNKEFAHALKGKVFPIFAEQLDFSSKETLTESWHKALSVKHFRYILNMLVANSTLPEPSDMTVNGMTNLIKMVDGHFPGEGREIVETLLGKTILTLLDI